MIYFDEIQIAIEFFSFVYNNLVDFVVPTNEQSLVEAYRQWRERADTKVCCDYGLHVTIMHWNDQVAKEMEILTKEKGFISIETV